MSVPSDIEIASQRPSLRPLRVMVGSLALAWLLSFGLILAQIA